LDRFESLAQFGSSWLVMGQFRVLVQPKHNERGLAWQITMREDEKSREKTSKN